MSVVLRWNASGSRVLPIQTVPTWREVRRGLRLLLVGYWTLLVLGLPGLGLIWLTLHGHRVFQLPLHLAQNEDLVFLGLLLLGAAGLLGFGLILWGQWHCLKHAPQHHAKELLFAAIFCILVGPVLPVVAHYTGGERNYVVFQEGLEALRAEGLLQGAGLLQLAGLCLTLVNFLLVAQFLWTTGDFFHRPGVSRAVDFQAVFVCLLVGTSVGTFLCVRPSAFGKAAPLGLAIGWLTYFLSQVILTLGARRCIGAGLRDIEAGKESRTRQDSQTTPKPYSGLHRFRVMMQNSEEF
jgi:hypothetical protein